MLKIFKNVQCYQDTLPVLLTPVDHRTEHVVSSLWVWKDMFCVKEVNTRGNYHEHPSEDVQLHVRPSVKKHVQK